MSRHLELKTQLEIEAGVSDRRTAATAGRAVVMACCPHSLQPFQRRPR